MTYIVMLCMWIDGACKPTQIVGYGDQAHAECLIYTYRSPYKDGCYTYAIELDNI